MEVIEPSGLKRALYHLMVQYHDAMLMHCGTKCLERHKQSKKEEKLSYMLEASCTALNSGKLVILSFLYVIAMVLSKGC